MKKILIVCGLAICSVGLYSFDGNSSYVHEDYSTISTENFQDTLPGRKRDTSNRKPTPQDTIKRDSGFVKLMSIK